MDMFKIDKESYRLRICDKLTNKCRDIMLSRDEGLCINRKTRLWYSRLRSIPLECLTRRSRRLLKKVLGEFRRVKQPEPPPYYTLSYTDLETRNPIGLYHGGLEHDYSSGCLLYDGVDVLAVADAYAPDTDDAVVVIRKDIDPESLVEALEILEEKECRAKELVLEILSRDARNPMTKQVLLAMEIAR